MSAMVSALDPVICLSGCVTVGDWVGLSTMWSLAVPAVRLALGSVVLCLSSPVVMGILEGSIFVVVLLKAAGVCTAGVTGAGTTFDCCQDGKWDEWEVLLGALLVVWAVLLWLSTPNSVLMDLVVFLLFFLSYQIDL